MRRAVVPCCSHGAPRNLSLLASQVLTVLKLIKLPQLETPKRNHHAHIWSGTLCRLGLATQPHFNIALVVRKREQTGKQSKDWHECATMVVYDVSVQLTGAQV